MKKLNFILIPAMALFATLFVSCTPEKEDDKGSVTPVFPAEQSVFVQPGATADVAFTANVDWTASISAEEAKGMFVLVDGSQEVYSQRGKAGDAGVKVLCKAKEQDFEDHSIDISLTMNGETKKIATVTLPAAERHFELKSADLNESGDGFKASAEGEPFDWSYTGAGIVDKGDIRMLWVDGEKAYIQHILVDMNYDAEIAVALEGGVSYQLGKTSGTKKEYLLTVAEPNLTDADRTVNISFTAKDDNTLVYEYAVIVPKFKTVFNVYPVQMEDGDFKYNEGEDSFMYVYDDVALNGDAGIRLEYSESNIRYNYHILVESNFSYVMEKSDWLDCKVQTTVGNITEYDLWVTAGNFSEDAQDGKVTFKMEGADLSFDYKVVLPASKDIYSSTVVKNLEFNSQGQYNHPENGYVESPAMGYLATFGQPSIRKFEKSAEGSYVAGAAWLDVDGDWDGSSKDKVQRQQLRIKPAASTEARSALVVAIPESLEVADGDLFSGNGVKAEYEKYVIAYVEQHGAASRTEVIAPTDPDDLQYSGTTFASFSDKSEIWWSALSPASEYFYQITETRLVGGIAGTYSYFKFERPFTSYSVYDGDGNPVSDKENFWAVLENDKWSGYSITITPEYDITGLNEAYFVFADDKGEYAMLAVKYDPSAAAGDGEVSFSWPEYAGAYDGTTLRKIEATDPEYGELTNGGTVPVYEITYTKFYASMSSLKGVPTDMMQIPMYGEFEGEWFLFEPGESALVSFAEDCYEGLQGKRTVGFLQFYGSDWTTALTLVIVLDLTAVEPEE